MSEKIKILLLAANSVDTVDSRTAEEMQAIARAIQTAPAASLFEIIKEPALRISDIGPLLLRLNPDVLHLGGHARPNEGLILEDEFRQVAKITCAELTDVVLSARTNLKLVFFSFCYSAGCAKAAATEIDFALGVKGEISDESALIFSPAFYEALVSGKTIPAAINYGKKILAAKKREDGETVRLEVREGGDPVITLAQLTAVAKDLKPALERIARGMGTETDRKDLRNAIDEGVLVVGLLEVEDQKNPGTVHDVNLFEDAGILHAGLTPAAYQKFREAIYPIPPGIAPPLPPGVFIGRENDRRQIKQLLMGDQRNNDERNITVVRGWPGVGKTSLVGALGHDAEILRTFSDGILWTSLEQEPHLISELARWGRALGSEEILRSHSVTDATAQLAALLSTRRMLLIVDDVWQTGHATAFALAAGERCSVLVTTRLPAVAEALTRDSHRIYNLPVLTVESALMVLRILVPEVVLLHERECKRLAIELECLPLALHVAAGLLRSEAKLGWGVTDLIDRIREGTELMKGIAPKDRIEKNGEIPSVKVLLQRSTDVLDDETRDYFNYLGAFAPKPATFDLAAMQAVWEVDDPKPIIRKLVGHGLLEPLGKARFQMHRILVDHAKSLCT